MLNAGAILLAVGALLRVAGRYKYRQSRTLGPCGGTQPSPRTPGTSRLPDDGAHFAHGRNSVPAPSLVGCGFPDRGRGDEPSALRAARLSSGILTVTVVQSCCFHLIRLGQYWFSSSGRKGRQQVNTSRPDRSGDCALGARAGRILIIDGGYGLAYQLLDT